MAKAKAKAKARVARAEASRLADPPVAEREVFPLAPIAPIYVVLTGVLLAIPTIWWIIAATRWEYRSAGVAMGSLFTGVAAVTWLSLRPTRFVVDRDALFIEWPVRTTRIDRGSITSARVLTRSDLPSLLGRTFRVGVGGLFGNFGLMWSSRRGWIATYVATSDDWVFVDRKNARPLLISPANAADFLRAIAA